MLVTKRLHKLLFTYKTLSRILKNTNTNIKNAAVKAVKLLIVLNISLISCKIFYGGISNNGETYHKASITRPDSENRFCPEILRITLKSLLNLQEKTGQIALSSRCLLRRKSKLSFVSRNF